jgi:predicted nucleotidyltransferase
MANFDTENNDMVDCQVKIKKYFFIYRIYLTFACTKEHNSNEKKNTYLTNCLYCNC